MLSADLCAIGLLKIKLRLAFSSFLDHFSPIQDLDLSYVIPKVVFTFDQRCQGIKLYLAKYWRLKFNVPNGVDLNERGVRRTDVQTH